MTTETKTEGETAAPGPARRRPIQQALKFTREHPDAALLAAAGAGALLGGELAIGALVGAGAALLLANKPGRELREGLRTGARRTLEATRAWVGRLQERRRKAVAPLEAPPPPAAGGGTV